MSRVAMQRKRGDGCFPRVSGDEPSTTESLNPRGPFSPRERG